MAASGMQFPCSFPVTVMGLNTEAFSSAVLAIFRRQVGDGKFTFSERTSSGNKYLSLTVTFTADSSDQLNDLYEELNRHDLVLMTL